MIFADSRYADGNFFRAYNSKKGQYDVVIFREMPNSTATFFYYTWVEGDRLDLIANEFLGDSNSWWKIMDFNPEVIDPLDIPIGYQLRIPGV